MFAPRWALLLLLPACSEVGVKTLNGAPEVAFVSPADGAVLDEGDALTLAASVVDDNTATDALLRTWTLGDGSVLAGVETVEGDAVTLVLDGGLSAGDQTIRLQAIDGAGEVGEDTLSLVVEADGAPAASLESPTEGERVAEGSPVLVSARFADAETEDLQDLSITWGGAAAGAADAPAHPDSTGVASFYLSGLAAGDTVLSVTVADAGGQTASASVLFEVVDPDLDGDGHEDAALGGDDCDDADAERYPGAEERCDGVDEDCDGVADDDATDALAWYADLDGDGYGAGEAIFSCEAPDGAVDNADDCEDTNAEVNPGAAEICDADDTDEDCDGLVDDADDSVDPDTRVASYVDADGDGYGDPASEALACDPAADRVSLGGDCDDADRAISPAATEICDPADADEDCDGLADDADPSADAGTKVTTYADNDGDGYGDPGAGEAACDPDPSRVYNDADCDDTDKAVNPDAEEICDGLDNDCDGDIDSDAVDRETWYADADGDSYGDADTSSLSCSAPSGAVADATDCDDDDDGIHPGADEHCDGMDEDCDGEVDEDAVDGGTWYVDEDGDGYGSEDGVVSCDKPATATSDHADCDDASALVYPGATELCDGKMNDCEDPSWASTDEDGTASWVSSSGAISTVTSALTGTAAAPATVTLSSSGTLYICDGTWYVNLHVTGSDVAIVGANGAERTILSGGGTTEDIVSVRANNVTLAVDGITITDGAGCFPGLNNVEVSWCLDSSAGYTSTYGDDITVSNSIITGNHGNFYGGIYSSSASRTLTNSVTLIDTEVSDNSSIHDQYGPEFYYTNIYCYGSAAVRAGFWSQYYGVLLDKGSSLYSYGCDWGTGTEDNIGDVYTGLIVKTGYGDDETFQLHLWVDLSLMNPTLLLILFAGCAATPSIGVDDGALPTLRVPAEWEPQEAVWLQWPRPFEASYEPDFARIIAAILAHENVHVLVNDSSVRASAEASLAADGGLSVAEIGGEASVEGFTLTWHEIPNDNAWMRDNGPRYVLDDGQLRIQDWGFDAWGGAYGPSVDSADDDAVPTAVGALLDLPVDTVDLVHERGDLEFNGTDAVLLNWSVIGDPARNPDLTREQAEAAMKEHFGVSRVVMIEGTPNYDLTGGHIDGIARFLDADRVVVADCSTESSCVPGGHDDQIYDAAASQIEAAGFEVLRWPFETQVRYRGVPLDTDYMNWLVGNDFVLDVGFGDEEADAHAKAQLEEWFPGREVVIIEMLASWYAGGGVHCHTNDQPADALAW